LDKSDHTKPYVIGISGGSGSGKTSFVKDLISLQPPENVSILTMDNYYLEREMQKTDENGVKNFDLPESINILDFKNDLNKLLNGETVNRIEYTFNNDEAVPKEVSIQPSKVLLIEGLFIYSEAEISELIDLKLIINAKDIVKVIRRIKRDKAERNYPVEDVIYRYEHHVLPSFEKYIMPYINTVDVVINNNDSYKEALALISHFVTIKAKN